MTAKPFPPCRGSALVLVLWCIMLLSLAVFAVVEMVDLSVDHASHEKSALVAQTWAASGAAVGQVPQLLPDDPVLKQKDSEGHGFSVTIQSEGARLNLNFLLLNHRQEVLLHLFTSWGLQPSDAQHAAASLYDWVTPGDLPSLGGAKAAAYAQAGLPQRPTHQPFQSLGEAAKVMGMDLVAAARPNWQDSFTLWSEGPLDLNAAPADRIAALFGIDVGQIKALVNTRDGRDGVPGTLDDTPLTAALLRAELGLTDIQMKTLQNQFAFGSVVRRIESTGQTGPTHASLVVVTRLNTVPPQLLVWSKR